MEINTCFAEQAGVSIADEIEEHAAWLCKENA